MALGVAATGYALPPSTRGDTKRSLTLFAVDTYDRELEMCLHLSDDPGYSSWDTFAMIPSRRPAYNNCQCEMEDAPSV